MTSLASAIVDLGLSLSETLSLTPRHLDYLNARFLEREKRESERFCFLVASVHNMMCADPDKHITAADLMETTAADPVEKWAESQVLKFENFNQEAVAAGAKPLIKKWVPNGG